MCKRSVENAASSSRPGSTRRAFIRPLSGMAANSLAFFIFVLFVQTWDLLDLYRTGTARWWLSWRINASTYATAAWAAVAVFLFHVILGLLVRRKHRLSVPQALVSSVHDLAVVRVYYVLLLSLLDWIAFKPIFLTLNILVMGTLLRNAGRHLNAFRTSRLESLLGTHRFSVASSMLILLVPFFLVAMDKTDGTYSRLLTGDTPSYLLITESICEDFDLDLSNNRLPTNIVKSASVDTPDFRRHNPDIKAGTAEYAATRERFGGQVWSTHRCGTSIAIAPAYAVGALLGGLQRPFVALWLSFMLALGVNEIRRTCFVLTKDTILSASLAFGTVVSIPVVTISTSVYPEILMFVIMGRAIHLCVRPMTWPHAIEMGLLMGAAPWLQDKYALWMAPLWMAYWIKNRRLIAPMAVSAGVGFCFLVPMIKRNMFLYGQIMPKNPLGHFLSLSEVLEGSLFGIWFDWGYGLLPLFPLLTIAPLGFMLGVARKSRRTIWISWAIAAFSGLSLISFWYCWHGGFSPPNRFTLTLIPLLIPAVAIVMARLDAPSGKLVLGVLGVGVLMGLGAMLNPEAWYTRKILSFSGANVLGWDALLYRFSYFSHLPQAWVHGVQLAALWGLFLVFVFLGIAGNRRRLHPRLHTVSRIALVAGFLFCAYTNPYTGRMNSARPRISTPALVTQPLAIQNARVISENGSVRFLGLAKVRKSTVPQKYSIYLHGYDEAGNMTGTWDFSIAELIQGSPTALSTSSDGFTTITMERELIYGEVAPERLDYGLYRVYPSGRSEREAALLDGTLNLQVD